MYALLFILSISNSTANDVCEAVAINASDIVKYRINGVSEMAAYLAIVRHTQSYDPTSAALTMWAYKQVYAVSDEDLPGLSYRIYTECAEASADNQRKVEWSRWDVGL